MSVDRRFRLPPLGRAPVLFAVAIGALVPIGVAVALVGSARAGEISLLAVLGIQAGVALAIAAALVPVLRREVAFDDHRLRVKATWYTREVRLDHLRLDQARVVDLREHTELKPLLKTNGFALPGLQAGHFRLRDRGKAFCLVLDPGRVLLLPHVDGSRWLLSFENPRAVLSVLQEAAARAHPVRR